MEMNIQQFLEQDGGIVKTIYSNHMTLANLVMAEDEVSEELKEIASQLKRQTEAFYKAYTDQLQRLQLGATNINVKGEAPNMKVTQE